MLNAGCDMIQVTVWKDSKKNRLTGFHTLGHAGYAQKGQDIICSAVSAVILTTINSIEALTEEVFSITQDPEAGEIDFRFQSVPQEQADLLLRSMVIGLQGISEEYGTQYLKVSTKEV